MNQLADDLTNEKFDSFDPEFRVPLEGAGVPLEGAELRWRVLDKLLGYADNFYNELRKRKAAPIEPSKRAKRVRKLKPW